MGRLTDLAAGSGLLWRCVPSAPEEDLCAAAPERLNLDQADASVARQELLPGGLHAKSGHRRPPGHAVRAKPVILQWQRQYYSQFPDVHLYGIGPLLHSSG